MGRDLPVDRLERRAGEHFGSNGRDHVQQFGLHSVAAVACRDRHERADDPRVADGELERDDAAQL
jgi:hypothetical protein